MNILTLDFKQDIKKEFSALPMDVIGLHHIVPEKLPEYYYADLVILKSPTVEFARIMKKPEHIIPNEWMKVESLDEFIETATKVKVELFENLAQWPVLRIIIKEKLQNGVNEIYQDALGGQEYNISLRKMKAALNLLIQLL